MLDKNKYCKYENTFNGRRAFDMNDELPHMHYSDSYWNKERTIFGSDQKELSYAYDDRLMYFHEAHNRGKEKAKNIKKNTPKYYQEYLRGYYEDDKLEIVHIVGGVNLSNGYPYMAFGWKAGK